MGVPKFFRYMSERYPCLSELVREYQVRTFHGNTCCHLLVLSVWRPPILFVAAPFFLITLSLLMICTYVFQVASLTQHLAVFVQAVSM